MVIKKYKKQKKRIVSYGAVFLLLTCLAMVKTGKIKIPFDVLQSKIVKITDAYIKRVTIIGASPKVEKLISDNLGTKEGDSIFNVSTTNMLNNLTKIGWIKEATIHKTLPNIITIKIVERIPIAVYYHNKRYDLIDSEGTLIEQVNSNPGLPLIAGDNANFHVQDILAVLNNYPQIKIRSLIYIQNRRWDLILDNKLKVKLPDKNIQNALKTLSNLFDKKNIQHSVTVIDMRINDNIIMQGLSEKDTGHSSSTDN